MDNRLFLKVKLKSLAAESCIIRSETKRAPKAMKDALATHRRGVVRLAARSTLLAYSFLRGKPYHAIERSCHLQPNWQDVRTMVKKYGRKSQADETWEAFDQAKKDEAKRLEEFICSARVLA